MFFLMKQNVSGKRKKKKTKDVALGKYYFEDRERETETGDRGGYFITSATILL